MIRPLDTSRLGPIRVPLPGDLSPRDRARDRIADALLAKGPSWRNAADSVRSGSFSNLWIEAGLDALERLIRTGDA